MQYSPVLSGLMGVCVGDALGVPVEFNSRSDCQEKPITTMVGYGTYHQPAGTWSDDSSLTFCLAESLCNGYNLHEIAKAFCKWMYEGYWTPYGNAFDIGGTTYRAISRLREGVEPIAAGGTDIRDNGNGSLMRILPLAYGYNSLEFPELIKRVHDCSRLTHGHPRSQMACGIYISIAVGLLQGMDIKTAYIEGLKAVKAIYTKPPFKSELSELKRVWTGEIKSLPENAIASDGYVVHTLEASLWCLLKTSSYAEAVLTAVNLGSDTDTTGAVTGGLAGIYYGFEQIPSEWVKAIARREDIIDLANRLAKATENS
ncbi:MULTISPECIES: ADP-ribosylglycohydrolase family protein [Limnospira]|uniref:ADP-ribosylation/Crystallin J1 n=1 Tax=Limnospira maxima CS-328 TaxID=513049 RepID=B5W8I2_LIMMA|nr:MULTISPECIES: ADP-ribosylglycohydrolase family protein [Limnospira]EDZ92156.1 ADP-ribosylation/Crystallin J1 [Limnospira maxima CS-328]MDC0837337.1 ADP-ribosylglycohydrolase family protein [Limnoraphis robusta]MDT9197138.1 ADP-ribosylglycohydrolase family protein [Limnospira sp. PMC 1042.18]